MNLRRIVKALAVLLIGLGLSQDMQAQQAQLAGVNQDGLLQLGSNHPFVVSTYEIDLSSLNFSAADEAREFFRKYLDEGLNLTFDIANERATLTFDLREIGQYNGRVVEVSRMNQKLRDVFRLRR